MSASRAVAVFIVIFCALFVLAGLFLGWSLRRECEAKALVMGVEWQYSGATGCMIHVEGQPPGKGWVPLANYRVEPR